MLIVQLFGSRYPDIRTDTKEEETFVKLLYLYRLNLPLRECFMYLRVYRWPWTRFFGLPRARCAGTSVGGRVVGTCVCSTGGKVNCPVAVCRDLLGTEAEN